MKKKQVLKTFVERIVGFYIFSLSLGGFILFLVSPLVISLITDNFKWSWLFTITVPVGIAIAAEVVDNIETLWDKFKENFWKEF